MAQHKRDTDDIAALNRKIADLKAINAAQQKAIDASRVTHKQQTKRSFSWRPPVIWLCVALATLLLVVGNVFFWAGNTFVDTNRYVATVGPLIQQPAIQTAIAQYTTTQLFNNVDVQGYIQETLPPRASVLAPALTTQLKSYTQTSLKTILASPKLQDYWYTSLRRRHDALIKFSQNYQGNGTIEVSDIYSQLSQRLADTKLSFLADKQLPPKVGSIKVATVGWLPALHKISKNIGLYQTVTTLLLVAFTALAVMLSSRRRRTLIRLGSTFAGFMLLTLVAVRIARGSVVSNVTPAYQSAAQVAYDTVLKSFIVQTRGLLLIGLLLVLVAWISGPYASASAVKTRVTTLLSGRLHQSIFGDHDNSFTRWVGQYKRFLQWGSIVLIALIMLAVQLSPKLVIMYGLLMLVSTLIIETLAASDQKDSLPPIAARNHQKPTG